MTKEKDKGKDKDNDKSKGQRKRKIMTKVKETKDKDTENNCMSTRSHLTEESINISQFNKKQENSNT